MKSARCDAHLKWWWSRCCEPHAHGDHVGTGCGDRVRLECGRRRAYCDGSVDGTRHQEIVRALRTLHTAQTARISSAHDGVHQQRPLVVLLIHQGALTRHERRTDTARTCHVPFGCRVGIVRWWCIACRQ